MLTQQDADLCSKLDAAAMWYDAELRRTPNRSFLIGKAQTCRDIARKVRARGAFVSERQRSYAEALVRWTQPMTSRQQAVAEVQSDRANENAARYNATVPALPPQATHEQQAVARLTETTLARIAQLFAAARAAGLQRPKIRLRTSSGKRITITAAPNHSRNAGCYYVKVQNLFNGTLYCGLITAEGVWRPTSSCPAEVTEALVAFNADPASVATAYGHATSHCCFCGLGLTDGRSVAMGYGPICAENYHLPWGEERAAQSVTVTRDANQADLEEARRVLAEEAARRRDREQRDEELRQRARRDRELQRERDAMRARSDALNFQRNNPTPSPAALFREDEDENFL